MLVQTLCQSPVEGKVDKLAYEDSGPVSCCFCCEGNGMVLRRGRRDQEGQSGNHIGTNGTEQ